MKPQKSIKVDENTLQILKEIKTEIDAQNISETIRELLGVYREKERTQ